MSTAVLLLAPAIAIADGTLEQDDAALLYGVTSSQNARERVWDDSAGTWGAASSLPDGEFNTLFTLCAVAPSADERITGTLGDTGTGTDLDIFLWNGSAWAWQWNSTAITSTNKGRRGFDIEYEAISGHGMVVYSNNTTNPQFRTWSSGAWSTPADVFASAPGTGTVRTIELVPCPGTDDIALVYSDANSDLFAIVWTGSSWDEAGSETTLDDSLLSAGGKPFDAAYEETTGDLLVAWGKGFGAGEQINYAVKPNGGAWSGALVDSSGTALMSWVDLAAEPGGQRIALAAAEESSYGSEFAVAMWTGSGWTNEASLDTVNAYSPNGTRYIGVGWVGTSGTAVAVYDDAGETNVLSWARWTSGSGWAVQTDVSIPAMWYYVNILVESFSTSNKLMVALGDWQSDVFAATYDGTSWTVTNGGAALETSVSSLTTCPFDFDLKRRPYVLLGDHRTGQQPDAFNETGSRTDAELYAFRLGASQAPGETINQVQFTLSGIIGLTDSSWAGVELIVDTNGDGSIGAGETTSLGGAGVVSTAGGTITFSSPFSLTYARDIILRADFASLANGDKVTIDLSPTGILTAAGNQARGAVAVGTTHREGLLVPGVDDMRIVYGEGSVVTPRTRVWRDSSSAWLEEESLPNSGATLRWAVHQTHPTTSEELAAVLSSSGGVGDLDMLRWTGSFWMVDWSSSGIAAAQVDKRGFDVEYEANTGDAVAVYSDTTSNLWFRTRSGGAWSAEARVFATPPGTGNILWVELVRRPASSEIALVYGDDNSDLFGVIWDGSAWREATTETTFTTTLTNYTTKDFDAAYEDATGDLLVAWGGSNDNLFYATKAAGSDTWVAGSVAFQARSSWLDLAPSPGDTAIAVIGQEKSGDGQDVSVGIWEGDDWQDIDQIDSLARSATVSSDFYVGVGWVGSSGVAIAIYADDSQTGGFAWARWTWGGGWVLQNDEAVTGMGETEAVHVESSVSQDLLMAVIADSNADLVAATYNGSTWTITNSGVPLETSVSSSTSVPFSLEVKSPQRLILYSHPTGPQPDAFTESGSAVDAEVLGFRLSPDFGTAVTVNQVVFSLSDISGLTDGDWDTVEIIEDTDGDGNIGGTETTTVGGLGVVSMSSGRITFSTSFTVSAPRSYILVSNFATLSTGDCVSLLLDSVSVSAAGSVVVVGWADSNTHYEGGVGPDDARLVYGEGAVTTPMSRIWSNGTETWSAEGPLPATSGTVLWSVSAVRPFGAEELAAVLSDTGASAPLATYRFDGSAWTLDWSTTSIAWANRNMRAVDVEYESASGDGLVVYSNNTANPVYRTRSGGTWSSETAVFGSAPGTGTVAWVELVRRPGTNRIALVYADLNADLFAIVWNGSSWDTATQVTLETSLNTTLARAFDAAYEEVTGDLMVAWGRAGGGENLQYRTLAAGSTSWAASSSAGTLAEPWWVDLAGEPCGERVAAVVMEITGSGQDVGMVTWDGSTWGTAREDSLVLGVTPADANQYVAVGWLGTSGIAIVVYPDSDSPAVEAIEWAEWTPGGGWTIQTDEPLTGMGDIRSVQIRPFLGQDKALVVFSESNSDLHAATYDGATWSVWDEVPPSPTDPLEGTVSSLTTVHLGVDIRSQQRLLVATAETGAEPDAFTGGSSATNAELCGFRLSPSVGGSLAVSMLIFSLSDISGLADGDWTGVELVVDTNGDGAIGAGETTTVGGVGSVYMAGGTITFSSGFTVSGQTHYILRADFTSLQSGDTVSVSLSSWNVLGAAQAFGETATSTHVNGLQFNGTVRQTDGVTALTGVAMNVSVLGNGVLQSTGAVNTSNGTFSVWGDAAPGQMILVYISSGSNRAVTVTESDGVTYLTGLDLILDRLVVRNDNGTASTSNAELDTAHGGQSEVTALYADGGVTSLTVAAGRVLHIAGAYTPGGSVTTTGTSTLRVVSGTFDSEANTVTVNGTLLLAGGTMQLGLDTQAGTVTVNGDFTKSGGSLVLNGNSSTRDVFDINGNATFSGGTVSIASTATSNRVRILCSGNWTVSGDSTYAPDLTSANNEVIFDGTGTSDVDMGSGTGNSFCMLQVGFGSNGPTVRLVNNPVSCGAFQVPEGTFRLNGRNLTTSGAWASPNQNYASNDGYIEVSTGSTLTIAAGGTLDTFSTGTVGRTITLFGGSTLSMGSGSTLNISGETSSARGRLQTSGTSAGQRATISSPGTYTFLVSGTLSVSWLTISNLGAPGLQIQSNANVTGATGLRFQSPTAGGTYLNLSATSSSTGLPTYIDYCAFVGSTQASNVTGDGTSTYHPNVTFRYYTFDTAFTTNPADGSPNETGDTQDLVDWLSEGAVVNISAAGQPAYTTLTEAISAASNGDTIEVRDNVIRDENIDLSSGGLNKWVTIDGAILRPSSGIAVTGTGNTSQEILRNCVFIRNTSSSSPLLRNVGRVHFCTIVGPYSGGPNALVLVDGTNNSNLWGCIVGDPATSNWTTGGNPINNTGGGALNVDYSDIQSGGASGTNMAGQNPLFVAFDAGSGTDYSTGSGMFDVHLRPDSPCVDFAAAPTPAVTTDFDRGSDFDTTDLGSDNPRRPIDARPDTAYAFWTNDNGNTHDVGADEMGTFVVGAGSRCQATPVWTNRAGAEPSSGVSDPDSHSAPIPSFANGLLYIVENLNPATPSCRLMAYSMNDSDGDGDLNYLQAYALPSTVQRVFYLSVQNSGAQDNLYMVVDTTDSDTTADAILSVSYTPSTTTFAARWGPTTPGSSSGNIGRMAFQQESPRHLLFVRGGWLYRMQTSNGAAPSASGAWDSNGRLNPTGTTWDGRLDMEGSLFTGGFTNTVYAPVTGAVDEVLRIQPSDGAVASFQNCGTTNKNHNGATSMASSLFVTAADRYVWRLKDDTLTHSGDAYAWTWQGDLGAGNKTTGWATVFRSGDRHVRVPAVDRIFRLQRESGVLSADSDGAGDDWGPGRTFRGSISTPLLVSGSLSKSVSSSPPRAGAKVVFGTDSGNCYIVSYIRHTDTFSTTLDEPNDDSQAASTGFTSQIVDGTPYPGFPYRVPGVKIVYLTLVRSSTLGREVYMFVTDNGWMFGFVEPY